MSESRLRLVTGAREEPNDELLLEPKDVAAIQRWESREAAAISDGIIAQLTEVCAKQDDEIEALRRQVRMLRMVLWTLWPWRFVARLYRKARR